MHAMIRSFSGTGAKELVDIIERRKSDVEKVVRSVKGLASYTMVRTKDGGFSVSVWEDKAAIDEVHKKALEWVKENASHTKVGAPSVTEGSVILQLK